MATLALIVYAAGVLMTGCIVAEYLLQGGAE